VAGLTISPVVLRVVAWPAQPGLPGLVEWLRALQLRVHRPPLPAADWSLSVTVGSQDAIVKCFDAMLGPGDSLLVDRPTYSGSLAYLKPMGVRLIGVETDGLGLVPDALERAITAISDPSKRPRVLYTIPTGQNPAGSTLSLERRRAVYALACKYDFIILEDDPYYYLVTRTTLAGLDGLPSATDLTCSSLAPRSISAINPPRRLVPTAHSSGRTCNRCGPWTWPVVWFDSIR
jgi:DNA-binding transcriptional MocR family regulator